MEPRPTTLSTSTTSSSESGTSSISLPSGPPPLLSPQESVRDTFGSHAAAPSTPLSKGSTPLSGSGSGSGDSRPSPFLGAETLPVAGASTGPGMSASTSTTGTGTTGTSALWTSSTSSRSALDFPGGLSPMTMSQRQPAGTRASFGPSITSSHRGDRLSAMSQESELSMSFDIHSQRGSWIRSPSPTSSTTAISVARKLRISSQYLPPHPPVSPRTLASHKLVSPAAAGAASTFTAGPATAAYMSSSSSLQPPSAIYTGAPQSPTSRRESRGSIVRRAREASTDDALPSPLGANSFASTTFPSMSPRGTPTGSINRDLPPLPGELPLPQPHYSFLEHDPTDSPLSMRGGVSHFSRSGSHRVSSQSVPGSDGARMKHLSSQSAYSDYATTTSSTHDHGAGGELSPAVTGGPSRASTRFSRWSQFAGGPPPAWGGRDSTRSVRSNKSTRSKRRSSKHASMITSSHGHSGPPDMRPEDWEGDDESVDLGVLVRRAAILERILRAGKRTSAVANKRVSAVSSSTRYSSRPGLGRNFTSQSRTSPSPTHTSPRRSAQSMGSIRHRLAQRLGFFPSRPFTGLGSDGSSDTSDESSYVDLGSSDMTSMSSHYYLPPPGTPPRRAVSTSSRYDPDIPLLSGQGAGVIVFPELELQNMPMLVPLRRNGEVCAQSCLPASAAVPYKPLPPPPPVQRLQGRSLHSLRNLRWVDEKSGHLHVGTWSNSSAPARASRASRNSSMLIGDVPRCDDHQLTPSARRLKIIIIIACIIVIGLLTGLLGGFLAHRERHRLSS